MDFFQRLALAVYARTKEKEPKQESMSKSLADQILYSEKYRDDTYEYRHVILPRALAAKVPTGQLLTETEWRALGISQSIGWIHYATAPKEPHILLFRRVPQAAAAANVPPSEGSKS